MSECEHVCKWQAMTIREPVHQRGQFFFTCIASDCPVGVLTAEQAEAKLNEHVALKREIEKLNDNIIRLEMHKQLSITRGMHITELMVEIALLRRMLADALLAAEEKNDGT